MHLLELTKLYTYNGCILLFVNFTWTKVVLLSVWQRWISMVGRAQEKHMDSLVAALAWLPQGMGNLSSLARIEPTSYWNVDLTTAPGKSLKVFMPLTESLESHPAHTSFMCICAVIH